ncbi:MAG: hypothetical protein JNL38_17930 [Myxococcales bacterium]|jgi:hypothetical protein|nr:hypothetical protein [Myxococcales bacterium]
MRLARSVAAAALASVVGCALVAPYPDLADDMSLAADAASDRVEAREGAAFDGAPSCRTGERVACFDGPPAQAGVGACVRGLAECLPDGGLGPCLGAGAPTAERCDTPEDESCDGVGACTGAHGWAQRYGDGLAQSATGVAVAEDGTVYVGGTFLGDLALPDAKKTLSQAGDALIPDSFVLAIDPRTQALAWSVTIPDSYLNALSFAKGTLALGGGTFAPIALPGCAVAPIVGGPSADAFVALVDASGTCTAARTFGDAADQRVMHLSRDPVSGDVAIAGTFGGVLDFGGNASPLDASGAGGPVQFYARLDPSLAGLRAFRLAPLNGARFSIAAIASSPLGAGDVVVGHQSGVAGFLPAVRVSPIAPGLGDVYGATGLDAFLVIFGKTGGGVQSAAGPGRSEAHAAAFDASGALHIAGASNGAVEFGASIPDGGSAGMFVIQRGGPGLPSGQIASFFPVEMARVQSMTTDGAGNVVVAASYGASAALGSFRLPDGGGELVAKLRIAKVGEGGAVYAHAPVWVLPLTTGVAPLEVAAAPAGEIAVAGAFAGALDPGAPPPLIAPGTATDAFLLWRRP